MRRDATRADLVELATGVRAFRHEPVAANEARLSQAGSAVDGANREMIRLSMTLCRRQAEVSGIGFRAVDCAHVAKQDARQRCPPEVGADVEHHPANCHFARLQNGANGMSWRAARSILSGC